MQPDRSSCRQGYRQTQESRALDVLELRLERSQDRPYKAFSRRHPAEESEQGQAVGQAPILALVRSSKEVLHKVEPMESVAGLRAAASPQSGPGQGRKFQRGGQRKQERFGSANAPQESRGR